jgi:hypothetical protein
MIDVEALKKFYYDLSTPDGMSVTDFHSRLSTLFAKDRSFNDKNEYRLGKKPWKKLSDEITPVSRFLNYRHISADRIRFPLDDNTPDCWLLNVCGEDRGIEVTIERGRERYHLAKEANENGVGRGFIGIQDDAAQSEFDNCMSKPRSMYSSEQAFDATKAGILRCLSKKIGHNFSKVFYLVIQAHLTSLSKERWSAIKEELSQKAASLPFKEVYVIGDTGSELQGFQIK